MREYIPQASMETSNIIPFLSVARATQTIPNFTGLINEVTIPKAGVVIAIESVIPYTISMEDKVSLQQFLPVRLFLFGLAVGLSGLAVALIHPSSTTFGIATAGAILATSALVLGKRFE